MSNIPHWCLDPENKETNRLNEILNAEAKKLSEMISLSTDEQAKQAAVYSYYRKYYSLTLVKTSLSAGINRSPTRDIILDYPWKELNLDRIICLKIWEKINH